MKLNGSPVYSKEDSFKSEFAFQKGKLAKSKDISVESLSAQEETEMAQLAANILKSQSEEAKKALQSARSHTRNVPDEILEATTEDTEYNLNECKDITRTTIRESNPEKQQIQENGMEK